MEPVTPSVGWGVIHLFYKVDRERLGSGSLQGADVAKHVCRAIEALEEDGHHAVAFTVLGHKADFGIMALGPDLVRLQAFQNELEMSPLVLTWSYLSLTEISEYTSTEEDERTMALAQGVDGDALEERLEAWRVRSAEYAEHRLHPKLPAKRAICFYPMSKRRDAQENWFMMPFGERKRLMGAHAHVGRKYAGRILQLITGSTGLDDWEWGVTLFADDPVALKDIVYEMRFDEGSARFAEFGPFITGLIGDPAEVMTSVGIQG